MLKRSSFFDNILEDFLVLTTLDDLVVLVVQILVDVTFIKNVLFFPNNLVLVVQILADVTFIIFLLFFSKRLGTGGSNLGRYHFSKTKFF